MDVDFILCEILLAGHNGDRDDDDLNKIPLTAVPKKQTMGILYVCVNSDHHVDDDDNDDEDGELI